MSNPSIRRLAEMITAIDRRMNALESTPQLGNSSIDDASLKVTDAEGNITAVIGKQVDGSFGHRVIEGPTPLAPSDITAEPGIGGFTVTWDGSFRDGAAAPMDLKHVAVHAYPTPDFVPDAANTVATFSYAEAATRVVPMSTPGTYYLKATSLSEPGKRSEATAEVQVEAGALVDDAAIAAELEAERSAREAADLAAQQELADLDGQLATAKTDIVSAQDEVDTLRDVTLPTMRTELEQADAAAQTELAELETRLSGIDGTAGDLEDIRADLAALLQAAQAAQATADAAVTAANSANQAALQAAGIADSKGKVIYSETEPAPEDQSASNLWIKPSTEETRVWDGDSWELITSDLLDQAAQNAIDARNAAEQAQQTAETALANAATAQAAAQAAQQTANQATVAAQDAHNAAVTAQERADSIRSDLAAGPSLWEDPSFERGQGGIPSLATGRIERSQDWSGSGSWSIKYTASGTGGNNYGTYGYLAASPGRWYMVSATVHADAHEQCVTTTWDARTTATNTGADLISYLLNPGSIIVQPNETKSNTWVFQAPSGTKFLRYWVGQHVDYNQAGNTGQVVYLDDFRVVDVTDSYPQYLAAKAAADAAKTRADEAYTEAASKVTPAQMTNAIQTSANGKNAITRSTSAPTSATPGVVAGDTWWRVDSNGDTYGQWIWNGTEWKPALIKNEMIASLDVNKLSVVGTAKINTAVIDKLWVDGIVGKSATFNQINIAAGNLVTDPNGLNPDLRNTIGGASWTWNNTGKYWTRAAVQGGTTQFNAYQTAGSAYDSNLLTAGAMYLIAYDVWVDKVGPSTGGRASIYYRRIDGTTAFVGDGTEAGGDTDAADTLVAGQWTRVERYWRAPADVSSGGINFQIIFGAADATEVRIRNPYIGRQASNVLIEDGAVNAAKINAESVGAAVGTFVNARVDKLVVSGSLATPVAVIDKLWADGISAKSVTTSRIAVTSGNLVPNGTGELGNNTNWPSFTYVASAPAETGAVGGFSSNSGAFLDVGHESPIPVQAGQPYAMDVWINTGTAGADTAIAVDYLSPTGAYMSNEYPIWPKAMPAGLARYEGSFTVPTGATHIRFRFVPSHSGGVSSTQTFYNFRVRPKVGAVLIQDGAVSADKLAADSVLAGKIKAGEIQTAHMAINSIAGDRITVNTLNGDRITANSIVAEKITGGSFSGKTFTGGSFVGSNFSVTETDSDGQTVETVKIGPSTGSNLITVGSSTVAPTSISTLEGNFSDLNVGGRSMSELLGQLPQGVVAWGQVKQSSDSDSDTSLRARRAELQTVLQPNRLYKVSLSGHYVTSSVAGGRLLDWLHYSFDSTPIPRSGTPSGVYQGASARHVLSSTTATFVPGMEFYVDTGGWSAARVFWCMYSMQSESGASFTLTAAGGLPVSLVTEDIGATTAQTLKRWNDANGGGTQDPEPVLVRYTKTYDSNGFRCYNLDGTDAGKSDVVHGSYSGAPSNFRRRGGWTFPSMTSDLSGATIEKIEMYAYVTHTYSSAGSTINPAVWGGVMANNLTAFTSQYNWKANTGRWITIPSTYHAGFKSGTYAGVGVIPTSSSTAQYARLAASGAKIRITYVK